MFSTFGAGIIPAKGDKSIPEVSSEMLRELVPQQLKNGSQKIFCVPHEITISFFTASVSSSPIQKHLPTPMVFFAYHSMETYNVQSYYLSIDRFHEVFTLN